VAVDVISLAALVALLATAYLHPPAWVEAGVALLAAGAVLGTGTLSSHDLSREREHLLPVVLFLVGVLVVAECCRAAGLFAAIGSRLAGAGRPAATYTLTFAVAAAVTVILSLDATVVLLTPVAMAAAATTSVSSRPFQLVCVRLANVASLLLPVSNLTNLLALPALDLSVGRFALLMAPIWLLVLAIEYAVHRAWFRTELRQPPARTAVDKLPLPSFPLVVVTLMLAGFAAGSLVDPAWVAGVAAAVLVVRALVVGELTTPGVVRSAQVPFAVFVLALGIVVAALGQGPLGDRLADLVPGGPGLGSMLLVALIGAVLANLVNNLPATLLLIPLVAPLGDTVVLATLIGINLGSSMTWSGSLANLLWRRTVRHSGGEVDSHDFHLVGLLATPVAIVSGIVLLNAWAGLV
jgi:arsenical pump membrane protein